MRLYDEKRKQIKIGDIIKFTNIQSNETITCKVMNLYRYSSFKDIYLSFNKERLGYKKEENANYLDMEKYYDPSEIKKYGVIGIEIKRME